MNRISWGETVLAEHQWERYSPSGQDCCTCGETVASIAEHQINKLMAAARRAAVKSSPSGDGPQPEVKGTIKLPANSGDGPLRERVQALADDLHRRHASGFVEPDYRSGIEDGWASAADDIRALLDETETHRG